jgi:RnfABCDGE-type electron transport complex G subunit
VKEQAAFEAAIKDLFPEADDVTPPAVAGTQGPGAGAPAKEDFLRKLAAGEEVAAMMKGSEAIGYVAIGAAQGYSSRIRVMVGARPDMSIRGIRILYAAETPGLGEKVKEVRSDRTLWRAAGEVAHLTKPAPAGETAPWFQAQFAGKTIDKLVVVKDAGAEGIQAITAATVTSQAVTNAARSALDMIRKAVGAPGSDAQDAQAYTSATSPGEATVKEEQ